MKRGRKIAASKGNKGNNQQQPIRTSRSNGSSDNKVPATPTLPKIGSLPNSSIEPSTGEHVLNARVESGSSSLPEVPIVHKRRGSSPKQKVYVYNNTKPVHLRLRTPSPERRRRNLNGMDKADAESNSTLDKVMEDLNVLRNTRAKMEERAILKYQNRFTELPTPVWNPPPKAMPRNNEIIQRVLDRRDVGQAGVLHPESRRLPFDMNLLKMAYDAPAEVTVQAGGWGFGASSEVAYPAGSNSTVEEMDNQEISMALESVADSLIGVAQNLIDSVFLNDSWRFFRRTGGNGVEWTLEEALNRRKLLPNPFGCLVLAAWHEAGRWNPSLNFTKFDFVDDETLCAAAGTNPIFITLNLKGCVNLTPKGIRNALAARGKGLLSLDLSNGVRSCGEIFKPLNYKESEGLANSCPTTVQASHVRDASEEGSEEAPEKEVDEKVNEALSSVMALSLNRCPGFSPSILSFVALRCSNLKELDVSYNGDGRVNDTSLRWLAAACPTLQKLKIDRSVAVTDIGMRTLVTRCTRLTHLHASFCPQITGKFFLIEPAHEKAPSRVVVKCRQLQLLDLSHCEDLDPFLLSWAGSSASRLRHVNVRGTPAIADGPSLFALCHCTQGMESLVIDSAKPLTHRRPTSLDYGDDQDEGPCVEEAPRVFGHRGRPLSSHALITALCELPFNRGLLELECDDLSDHDLSLLLKQQGKILRVLKLKHAIRLVGNKAFEWFTHVDGLNEMAYDATHKKRLVDRHGEEPPCVEGDLVLGELQTLEIGCAHKLKPVAFIHLASLQLPNLKSLSISGLRGGGNRYTGELSVLIKEVGPHLESLSLEDMIINDSLAGAIAEGCRPRYAPSSSASVGSGGSAPPQMSLFSALGGKSQKPTKKSRQYTTVHDLPKLNHLVLEYVRDPKTKDREQMLDKPRKKRSHLKRRRSETHDNHHPSPSLPPQGMAPQAAHSDTGSVKSSQEGSEPGTPAGNMSGFHQDMFTREEGGEPMSAKSQNHSDWHSEASFSEFSDSASDISATHSGVRRRRRPRSVRSAESVAVNLAKYGGMTDIGLSLIVSAVGSCLKSFKLLGFDAVSGNKVFDLPGAVGVKGIGPKHHKHDHKHSNKKQSHKLRSLSKQASFDEEVGSDDHDLFGEDSQEATLSARGGFSLEATPLRSTTRAGSRMATRPGSAKKLSFTPEVLSPKPDLSEPYSPAIRFHGMPAGILKSSFNLAMPSMSDNSRMEFSSHHAAREYRQKKQAEELELQAAGLRCYSTCHAPSFMRAPSTPKDGRSKHEGGHGKHRGRRRHRGGHSKASSSVGSVSSTGSRSRTPSKDVFQKETGFSSPQLTEGRVSTHNKLMENKHGAVISEISSQNVTRIKLASDKKQTPSLTSQSSRDVCAVEALNQGEEGGSVDEASLTEQEKKELKRERKQLRRQAQRRAAMLNKDLNEREKERVSAAPPGWSLPALKEIALVGCKHFSVKGLNRLVANTPQLRRLDATDCTYLVPRVGKREDELNSASADAGTVGASNHGGSASEGAHSSAKSVGGGSVLGSLKSFGGGSQFSHRKKKKLKVDWAALSSTLPYTRPAPKHMGLAPAPDADALAWRDAYVERRALEKRACRTVMNCFRSFKFRRVYIVRHAAFVLTKFWRTFNIGMLKVLRLHWKVSKKRRLRRQFFLNLYSALNAGRLMRRVARGAIARARTRTLMRKMMLAATKIQRMVRSYFDFHAYFKEVARQELARIIDDDRFGFDMPVKFHHKPPYSEAKLMMRVQQIPLLDYGEVPVKLTIDGRMPFNESTACTGTGFTGDMDVRRAFRASDADIFATGETVKKPKKQPLGMPERPKSYYN